MITFVHCIVALAIGLTILPIAARADDDVGRWIAEVQSAGAEGSGSERARRACDRLVERGPTVVPELLAAMDTPNIVAANWLRTAFDRVVARAIESNPESLPNLEFRKFVLDPARQGRVRRLALDVLSRLEPGATASLIPPLLDDPEFRRDAVTIALANADRAISDGHRAAALESYTKAFDAARDVDQVRSAAAKLKSLGQDVSITAHFGFLVDWQLIGPFDGPAFTSFSDEFPPEQKLDLHAEYNIGTRKLSWKQHRTPDEFGTVDLVKALSAADDAAAYATAAVFLNEARQLQLRCGADDNITIWLNGQKVFAKEEWQNGTRLDRFIVPVQFHKGENRLLLKICQGPKYRDPGMANPWSFQIRICDQTGRGVVLPQAADR